MLKNSTILLVRHGEKPGDPGAEQKADGPGLSADGQARAQAYVEYFLGYSASDVGGTKSKDVELQWVFATADDPGKSYRPRLTVSPFAEAALLPFSPCIKDGDYGALVKHLYDHKRFDDASILICWHHGKIIDLANALLTNGGKHAMPALSPGSCWPKNWPPEVFGWLLQICFDAHGTPDVSWIRCINERLMADDTKDPCDPPIGPAT